MEKKRANVAQVARVYSMLNEKFSTFEKKATAAVQQLYGNDSELKNGLTSAEFNLRAHQKVLNAICLELERFRTLFQAILPPGQRDILEERIVQMSEVTLPSEEEGGEPMVVQRPNWPYYHGQVERDLKILAEIEAQKQAEAREEQEKIAAEKAAQEAAQQETELKLEAAMDDASVEVSLPQEIEELGEDGAKEEAQDEPPRDDNSEFPDGAAVFGG